MQITEKTMEVLKNFASINSGMVLRPGKTQSTISVDEVILAEAKLDVDFPMDFGIYELSNLLSNLSLLKSPNLFFNDSSVTISDNEGFSLEFRGCPTDLVKAPDVGLDLQIEEPDAKISLSEAQLQKLLKVANINQFAHFKFIGKNGKLTVKVHDRNNDTSNSGTNVLGDYTGSDFEAVFKTEQLKMLPRDYNISIKKDAFALFESIDGNLKYFVALEGDKN